jgi:LytS/YehU family sensor histidine kinase
MPVSTEQDLFLYMTRGSRLFAIFMIAKRRRLHGLFGHSFQLEVRSEIGEGTTITMRIPLQTRFEVMGRSLETLAHA